MSVADLQAVAAGASSSAPAITHVVKRDGRTVAYDRARIAHAIEMAFRAEAGCPYPDALEASLDAAIERVTEDVENALICGSDRDALHIERIQDEVERQLMAAGHYAVARRYILYREVRAQRRTGRRLRIREADGRVAVVDSAVLRSSIVDAAEGLGAVDVEAVYQETLATLYEGVSREEILTAATLAARAKAEAEPAYGTLAARLLLQRLYAEATRAPVTFREMRSLYAARFAAYLERGVTAELLSPELLQFDSTSLAAALRPERDLDLTLMGIQTLSDRYLLHEARRRFELPQWFWMRVAMGLALGERPEERNARAIEFYEVLSTFRFCSSTPTLFNAGTRHPQLSSCFLTTIRDDLGDIFKAIRDDALLSKWSGGIGNDWTSVRSLGSHIHGTNGASQGVIPFLKVANDTAVAVNQGGKRQGAICAYLEVWHGDIEEYIELRKNTGDERRRTHDMHAAVWIPDLFMKRVRDGGAWTLFSPSDVPDLHDLYGLDFERRYAEYEANAVEGKVPSARRVSAVDLWRKLLTMLFETGYPWLTFKDAANVRSPQDHAGVIHSSNLCTEILLNTSAEEVAVCNLGSINLAAHVTERGIDGLRLSATVRTAVRMLDNVIDINLYPIPEARASNFRHRPIGLGLMGFQDALHALGLSYASSAAVEFADESMERIAYDAILASAALAAERGPYESYAGSKWDRGLLPLDTLDLLEQVRGIELGVPRTARLDWTPVRAAIERQGMRNSNVLAIAPTATIANICGVSQSIEPTYKNLYAKSTLSGEFTTLSRYLVNDLKELGLWDDAMIEDLKFADGSLQRASRVPAALKEKYLTAFEIAPEWLIECAARRQKWIDQSQSLNLYVAAPSGRRLDEIYQLAWERGLKTTYYLRTLAASGVEPATIDIAKRAFRPARETAKAPPRCDLDGSCDSCQ